MGPVHVHRVLAMVLKAAVWCASLLPEVLAVSALSTWHASGVAAPTSFSPYVALSDELMNPCCTGGILKWHLLHSNI